MNITELEIDGLAAKEEDLDIGTKVVWIHKGRKSYSAEILEPPSGIIYNL